MATPKNPLDKFVTYTTHFELYASTVWEDLRKYEGNNDPNLKTTRIEPTVLSNTTALLINTRADAHQTIDNVHFTTSSWIGNPYVNLAFTSTLELDVEEPGAMCFVEKLTKLKSLFQVNGFAGNIIFGLKIIFVGWEVGATSPTTIIMPTLIPLQFLDASGSFTHQGGRYRMIFMPNSTFLVKNPMQPGNLAPAALTQFNKVVTISAVTCQEALKELETKLNEHYKNIFEKDVNITGGRRIKYTINPSEEITGDLTGSTTESYAPGSKVQISFTQETDVVQMIRQILFQSKDVMNAIKESAGGVKQEFHPNVKVPVITPHYILSEEEAEVRVDIAMYKGEDNTTYEFDYYFADAGKNVDVMGMDIKFASFAPWLQLKTTQSTALLTNNDGNGQNTHATQIVKDVLKKDAKTEGLAAQVTEKVDADLPKNAVAIVGATTNDNGQTSTKIPDVGNARLAFSTLTDMCSSSEVQVSTQIRGHIGLLNDSNVYPDGSVKPFGSTRGVWIKVNVFMMVDGKRVPFYYTGYYLLLQVHNQFSGGKFIQNLSMVMMEPKA